MSGQGKTLGAGGRGEGVVRVGDQKLTKREAPWHLNLNE
jgi:hypothetical protein